jgi:transposase
MTRAAFNVYVETQLAPTLDKGDVVFLDNLGSHKSEAAAECLKARDAWFLFLPPYSPDLNPIEMAYSKLKAHMRAAKWRIRMDEPGAVVAKIGAIPEGRRLL